MTDPATNSPDETTEAEATENASAAPEQQAAAQDNAQAAEAASPQAAMEAEIAKYKDQWMRAAAECENLRKRAARDVEEANKYATTSFARDMVGVLDNLLRALDAATPETRTANEAVKNLAEGVELTAKELSGCFEKHGIRRVFPEGQKFDHNTHQAIAQVENPAESGTVVQVLQAGYTIHDRLLRPAMVTVSKGLPEASQMKVDTTV